MIRIARPQKEAITAAKIENGTIIGAKIALPSLGTVPGATHDGAAKLVIARATTRSHRLVYDLRMEGMNQTMRFLGALALALSIAALTTTGAAASPAHRVPRLKVVGARSFETYTQGNSVAISPSGVPWFGTRTESGPVTLGRLKSGRLSTYPLRKKGNLGWIESLQFDPSGALWFTVAEDVGSAGLREAIGRREPSGAITQFPLPQGEGVEALTIGPEGDAWFTSSHEESGAITQVAPSGTMTRFPLGSDVYPGSAVAGPDGAIWFVEKHADGTGGLGRITPDGAIQQYGLGAGVEPRQLVAGPDGALWFSENGVPNSDGTSADRIGRITTAGEVGQFAIPFGGSTYALATDPNGRIWFTTETRELSSISPTGVVGGRGCLDRCERSIVALAVTGRGGIWFVAGNGSCAGCGGSASLMTEDEGNEVGKIPAAFVPSVDAEEVAPAIRTLKPEGVSDLEALLICEISPHGHEVVIRFEWGRTKDYNHLTYFPEENPYRYSQHQEYEEFIEGLRPNTTYHYRAVAFYDGKKIYGKDIEFKTKR